MARAITMPCDHNNWEHVRIRCKMSTLRCRVCQKQFKLSYEALKKVRCHGFSMGNCARPVCKFVHVHASKQSLVERVEIHGEALLDNVPELDRPKEKEAASVCPTSPATSLSAASSTTTEEKESASVCPTPASVASSASKEAAVVCPTSPSAASSMSTEPSEAISTRQASVRSGATITKTLHFVHEDGSIEEYKYEGADGYNASTSTAYETDEDTASVAPYFTQAEGPLVL